MAVTRVSNSVIEDNSIDASKLSVSSNGTAGQLLKSNGDGTFSWDSESTYNNVYSIVVGTPPVDLDSIEKIAASINDDAAFYTTITGITGGLQNSIDAIEATDITLTINGDASGTATFTNLGDATLTLTIADDSHNHVISNVDGLQSALDLKASISYVDTSVANLIDSAPGALDTLNELAAALGDDANFAGTVTTALAGKQPIGTYNTIIGTDEDINTSGAIVVDQLNMTDGVIQSHSTRTMTLADLGYTGATNANYITSNNQLTNDAGYTTNVGDITGVTAGGGISGGGTSGTVTVSHADTSAQGSVNNSGATVVQDVTLDTYGHVTGLGSKTITLADLGYTGATNANNYVHPSYAGDDINVDTGALTGATVVSDIDFNITTDTLGHVTDANGVVSTRTLTLANLGYTGATNANYITNNNQLTNGAGYTTNVGDITGVTAGSYLTGGGTSGTVTLNVNATTASTGSTIVARDSSGDINVRLLRSEYDSTNASIGFIMTQVDTASNNYVRPSTPAQFRAAVTDGVYYPNTNPNGYTSNVGDITGVTAGNGLTGGGSSGAVTLNVVGSNGLTVSADAISLDSDLRGHAWIIGLDTNDYYSVGPTVHDWFIDGNRDMRLESDGDLHVDGDVIAYSTTTSDRRLKDNIKTIDNALDKVEQLRGVEYDWNKGSRKGQHEIGLIAQEVEEVFPFLVKEKVKTTGDFENDDTAYKSVDYEKLIGVLIESVKELSAKVKTLEAKLQ